MRYKKYTVNENSMLSTRSNTDGYQPKFLVDDKQKFLKVQCTLGGTLRDDWRVEDIASRICSILDISSIKQTPCKINIVTKKGIIKERLRVVSDNFELQGYTFISFQRLLETSSYDEKDFNFEKLNALDKIRVLIETISRLSNINIQLITKYMFDMITVDLLVLNQDRHFRNFGVFFNNNTNKYCTAKLFDFGMGLFENDTCFDNLNTLSECMRYSYIAPYIAPYGEDPFELLKMLKQLSIYRCYLKNIGINKIKLSKQLFIHPVAYEYFTEIQREMLNDK